MVTEKGGKESNATESYKQVEFVVSHDHPRLKKMQWSLATVGL